MPSQRVLTGGAAPEIRLLDDDLKLVAASRAKVNAAIAEAGWPHFRFEMKDKAVTHLERVIAP